MHHIINFNKQIFKDEKSLLKLSECKPPEIAFIKDANLFDKQTLFKIIKNHTEVLKLFPIIVSLTCCLKFCIEKLLSTT